ncbi:hypothetical protein AAMO2058_001524800 [Amorphochlora amoebiformis]
MPSFTDGLWGYNPDLFDIQARRLKTLDALVSFFKEKSALDQYYSRTLKKLARLHLMEHETPGSPLQAFLHGFRDLIETISTNYEILAAKEIDQMLNPLNRAKAKLQADTKTLRRESNKFATRMRKLQAIHKRTRHDARMSCKEAVIARRRSDAHARGEKALLGRIEQQLENLKAQGLEDSSNSAKHSALTRKTQTYKSTGKALLERSKQMKREFDQADNKYVTSVKACREFRAKHDSALTTVLRGLEKTERARINAVREGVRRYLGVEGEMSKKLLVSFQSVGAIAESVDSNDEINFFITVHKTGKQIRPYPEYIHFPSHEDVLFREKFELQDYMKKHKISREDKANTEQAKKLSVETRAIIKNALKDSKLDSKAMTRLDSILTSKSGRAAFAATLNHHRNHGFDNKMNHEISIQSFEILSTLMIRFLDHAYKEMDTAPAQLVMIMSQTFYKTEPKEGESKSSDTRIYLQKRVKEHDIWRSTRFWEEAFFQSLARAMKRDSRVSAARWHTNKEQEEAMDRRKKVLFGQLGAFAHNMQEFGMPVGPTEKFIQKICTINELGGTERNALLSIIRSATKNTPVTPLSPPLFSSRSPSEATSLESGKFEKSEKVQEGEGRRKGEAMGLPQAQMSPASTQGVIGGETPDRSSKRTQLRVPQSRVDTKESQTLTLTLKHVTQSDLSLRVTCHSGMSH